MAASTPTVTVSGIDKLAKSIGAQDKRFKRVIAGQFYRAKPDAETYAKTNAPWTNRTGNARSGLHAEITVSDDRNTFELLMAHSVFYGVFLENRWSGKFAILMPTINYIGQLLMDRIASSVTRIEGGE
jgi:hypothetical protein